MKYRVAFASMLLYAAAFLQAAPLASIRPFGVRMLLPLVLSVITGLLRGPFESLLMGFLYGLSLDVLMGRNLGLHAVFYAAVAWSLTLINEKLYREKIVIQSTFVFVATVLTETAYFLAMFLFQGYAQFGHLFLTLILPTALCNSLLVLPLYPPLAKAYARLDAIDRKRNRLGAGTAGRTT